jgi:hypothetical protein
MQSKDAEAVLTSDTSGLTATLDLERDGSGSQTWNYTSGILSIGSTGGVWKFGAWDSSTTRLVALYDGQDTSPDNAVAVFVGMPPNFIDQFCSSTTGAGSIVIGLVQTDTFRFSMDMNPCA